MTLWLSTLWNSFLLVRTTRKDDLWYQMAQSQQFHYYSSVSFKSSSDKSSNPDWTYLFDQALGRSWRAQDRVTSRSWCDPRCADFQSAPCWWWPAPDPNFCSEYDWWSCCSWTLECSANRGRYQKGPYVDFRDCARSWSEKQASLQGNDHTFPLHHLRLCLVSLQYFYRSFRLGPLTSSPRYDDSTTSWYLWATDRFCPSTSGKYHDRGTCLQAGRCSLDSSQSCRRTRVPFAR